MTRTGAAAGPRIPNGRPAIPVCMSLISVPPAASASPASSPTASMSDFAHRLRSFVQHRAASVA